MEKERGIFDLSAVGTGRLLRSDEGKRPTGESAGRGLRRTGELASCVGWDRKALKDEMAMEASIEAFWRGGEACTGGPSGRLGGFETCILIIIALYPPATIIVVHKWKAQRQWRRGVARAMARLFRVGKRRAQPSEAHEQQRDH